MARAPFGCSTGLPVATCMGRALELSRSPAGISSRLCSRTTSEIPLKAGGRPPTTLGNRRELASSRPGSACPRWAGDAAHRMGHSGKKTSFVRALAEIGQTTQVVWPISYSSSRGRGAARHSNRAVSTLTKARAVTRTRPPRRRAHRAFYWPDGREKPSPRLPSDTP